MMRFRYSGMGMGGMLVVFLLLGAGCANYTLEVVTAPDNGGNVTVEPEPGRQGTYRKNAELRLIAEAATGMRLTVVGRRFATSNRRTPVVPLWASAWPLRSRFNPKRKRARMCQSRDDFVVCCVLAPVVILTFLQHMISSSGVNAPRRF